MKNLNHNQQMALLLNVFPDADRIEWSAEFKQWDVTTIIGVKDEYGDENIDSYAYIPGTKQFRFVGRISVEI